MSWLFCISIFEKPVQDSPTVDIGDFSWKDSLSILLFEEFMSECVQGLAYFQKGDYLYFTDEETMLK